MTHPHLIPSFKPRPQILIQAQTTLNLPSNLVENFALGLNKVH